MKQKELIKQYLKDLNEWEYEYKIRGLKTPYGFIGARGDRNVRQMIKDNEIEAKFEGKYRIVRYKPEVKEVYKVVGNRDKQEILL
jgi:hypothetical protein